MNIRAYSRALLLCIVDRQTFLPTTVANVHSLHVNETLD